MQKEVSALKIAGIGFAVVLLTSCTVGRIKTAKYGLYLFDAPAESVSVVQNKKIRIIFKNCSTAWLSNPTGVFDEMKEAFEIEYGQPLLGLSNLEIEQKTIHDSTVFVPDRKCQDMRANPVTKRRIASVGKEEVWRVGE